MASRKTDSRTTHDSTVRIDKWLKVARLFKTRSLAQEAIDGGHVKMAGKVVKAGRTVQPGDKLTIVKGRQRLEVEILIVTDRSVSARDSHDLYRVIEEEIKEDPYREYNKIFNQMEQETARRGKPSKKERRDIDKFRNRNK